MTTAMAVTVLNRRSEIERLGQLVESFGETHGLSPDTVFKVNLALDEVITNVIRHAFDDEAEHEIAVRFDIAAGSLVVEIEDAGREFDPLAHPPPDLDRPIDERGIGGLGLHIVRSTMDEVTYRRRGGRNVLTLRKSLQ